MSHLPIETSTFTLAKGTQLRGDDYAHVKRMEGITVAVLCDGVGSAGHGGEAAQRTVQYLIEAFKSRPRSWNLEKTIRHFTGTINHLLYRESMEQYRQQELVTTLAMVVIEGNRLHGINVGDSRIYLLREGTLTQLSLDHTLRDEGMEHVLGAAIGLEEDVSPYYFENNLQAGDRILLCSDGLYPELSEAELIEGIGLGASHLVKQVSHKHQDNLPDDTTAIVLDIRELDPRRALKQADLTIQDTYTKGETIDGYRLIRPLIQNHRTWLVEKRGVHYVMKFAPLEAQEDEAILDHFVKEVWNARRLKAGFFPRAAVPPRRTHRYYIMPYLEGEPLDRIWKRPMGIDEGVALGVFLLRMGQFLIRRNLVHGDIKPENILRRERRGKRVFTMLDFGSITEAYTHTGRAGTPSYLSPERFHGAPLSESTEIYAIGVTLYRMLCGRFPYGEIEPFQTPSFDKTPPKPSTLNPNIPLWLESIILRAIDPKPNRRYAHYSEMLYELEHPTEVQPYFDTHLSLIERNPFKVCRIALFFSLLANLWWWVSG